MVDAVPVVAVGSAAGALPATWYRAAAAFSIKVRAGRALTAMVRSGEGSAPTGPGAGAGRGAVALGFAGHRV